MSQRHRRNEHAKVPKPVRRLDHRRERHAARTALLAADLDAVIVPPIRSVAVPAPFLTEEMAVEDRRWRHWKAPFWKRRNAERHRKNELLARLA